VESANQDLGPYFGLDDLALLEFVRGGDVDAYGELFRRYADFARRVARRVSRRDADDLVAEAFRRIFTAISRGNGPSYAFSAYLAAAIRSVAAARPLPYTEVPVDSDQIDAIATDDDVDVDPRVGAAFSALPSSWQQALWYSDVEGLPPRQAAPMIGLASPNAFSALRKRARAGLRAAYLDQVIDDACRDDMREYFARIVNGDRPIEPIEPIDMVVDEHLRECDACAGVERRIAAVSGRRIAAMLAPAVLTFHGFPLDGSALPSRWWLWRSGLTHVKTAALAKAAVVAGLTTISLGVGLRLTLDRGDANASVMPIDQVEQTSTDRDVSTTLPADLPADSTTTTAASPPDPSTSPSTSESPATSAPPTIVATTLVASLPGSTISPGPTATVATTTAPAIATTAPSVTTTTPPVVTTTTPPVTTTTTTTPPTTTTTTIPPPEFGPPSVASDSTVPFQGLVEARRLQLRVPVFNDAIGVLGFSHPIAHVVNQHNAICVVDATTCDINNEGVVGGDTVITVVFATHDPVTATLTSSTGFEEWTYTSPS
jgi:RNA polymerase sigma factor (sigma-70 family)